jgi:hypothetical protein
MRVGAGVQFIRSLSGLSRQASIAGCTRAGIFACLLGRTSSRVQFRLNLRPSIHGAATASAILGGPHSHLLGSPRVVVDAAIVAQPLNTWVLRTTTAMQYRAPRQQHTR